MSTFVIVGGDAAGMSAASKAKRDDPELDHPDVVLPSHVSHLAQRPDALLGGVGLRDLSGRVRVRDPPVHIRPFRLDTKDDSDDPDRLDGRRGTR